MVRQPFCVRLIQAIGFLVPCVWLAGTAAAAGFLEFTGPSSEARSELNVPSESTPRTGSEQSPMLAQLAGAQERLDEAERREARALKSLRKARQRKRPRGSPLEELRRNVSRSEVEREAAEENYLHLVESARRKGLQARFLSGFLDRAEQIESLRASRVPSARGSTLQR